MIPAEYSEELPIIIMLIYWYLCGLLMLYHAHCSNRIQTTRSSIHLMLSQRCTYLANFKSTLVLHHMLAGTCCFGGHILRGALYYYYYYYYYYYLTVKLKTCKTYYNIIILHAIHFGWREKVKTTSVRLVQHI